MRASLCPASNCSMRYCTFSRTSCCAEVGFRFSLPEAGLLAMLLAVKAELLLLLLFGYSIVFAPCRPGRLNLLFTKAQPTNSTGQDDWRKRGQRWWESGVVA